MINPTGKKLEKLLFGMFDDAIQGVDRYNHNGSLWLIFTDEMRWVVEYTKTQTLWYNYYFFKNEMEMVGLDCVEDKDLIQKWFESRFLNMNEVKLIDDYIGQDTVQVEDTIQNGVKEIKNNNNNPDSYHHKWTIEAIIQDGVKDTYHQFTQIPNKVEDTIQNGVKNTLYKKNEGCYGLEETIQDGVKYTTTEEVDCLTQVNNIIQNGVKETIQNRLHRSSKVGDAIQNGVKLTLGERQERHYSVENIIENGVKYAIPFVGKPFDEVNVIIQNGVKDTKEMNHDRHSYHGYFKLENDIPTHIPMDQVQDVVQNGVKEIIKSDFYRVSRITDVTQNGVKESNWKRVDNFPDYAKRVIQNGVKHCEDGDRLDGDERLEDIIENGVKEK